MKLAIGHLIWTPGRDHPFGVWLSRATWHKTITIHRSTRGVEGGTSNGLWYNSYIEARDPLFLFTKMVTFDHVQYPEIVKWKLGWRLTAYAPHMNSECVTWLSTYWTWSMVGLFPNYSRPVFPYGWVTSSILIVLELEFYRKKILTYLSFHRFLILSESVTYSVGGSLIKTTRCVILKTLLLTAIWIVW